MENKNLVKCKACGADIARGVKKCPHCGKDQRNFIGRHKVLTALGIIVILIIIGIASSGGSDNTATPANSTTKSTDTTKQKIEDKKYSYDKFLKIEMGATYEQVKAILGEGKEDSSTGEGDTKTIVYGWQNTDGSNISVTFQGDKVTNKAQAMLKSMDAKVTMDKYNQVKNGMGYSQVKNILGEGELTSQTSLLGTKSEIYSWFNSNGSNLNVTFTNGAVDTKAQFQLK
ncbi:DUF3862 domain-containing protein [Clostridium tyrobutyricum]|jgi:hypothetical protein|uniref:DUF3862 domain-containing protein n=1 Tax=Clostridium tyrobutyricum TaxID=1519 RepID=UPI001C38E7AB|nr:DUF3862 domain-containing protein [Clostridium tyrobutyricum]MBV4440091.1 DUF3862 domain-containing protein [Clostridium tyrobutyricum]